MQKTRKISIVLLSLLMLLCACTILSACGEEKVAQSIAVTEGTLTVSVYDAGSNGSLSSYKKTVLAKIEVTITYTDGTSETYKGDDQFTENDVYFYNLILTDVGEYNVAVSCRGASTTFKLKVTEKASS